MIRLIENKKFSRVCASCCSKVDLDTFLFSPMKNGTGLQLHLCGECMILMKAKIEESQVKKFVMSLMSGEDAESIIPSFNKGKKIVAVIGCCRDQFDLWLKEQNDTHSTEYIHPHSMGMTGKKFDYIIDIGMIKDNKEYVSTIRMRLGDANEEIRYKKWDIKQALGHNI